MTTTVWKLKSHDSRAAKTLAREFGLPLPAARILAARGYVDSDRARRFLLPRLDDLHDPALLPDLDKAVKRVARAIQGKEKVFVFGDYDVDGVTSIAALTAALAAAGLVFDVHQPNRLKEGYGMSPAAADLAAGFGAKLLIALDCGTEAFGAISRAAALGVDVIVLDHHLPKGELPPALAVVNPARRDSSYPFPELAAVGVVIKFLRAGEKAWKIALPWERLWGLAAAGTVADVVPLIDENRVFVSLGLQYLRRAEDPAFTALLAAAGIDPAGLTAGNLAFQVGPRLNAAGRLGVPELGRELFRASKPAEISALADRLNRMNQERRSLQDRIFSEAAEMIGRNPAKYLKRALVVEGEGWSKGVAGIVASKLQEAYGRPTVVIALEGESGTGSGRSVPGFDLFAALSSCAGLLGKFGGHQQAAGLSVARDRIDDLRDALDRLALAALGEEVRPATIRLDAALDFSEIDDALIDALEKFEPCGMGNPRPLFGSRGVRLLERPKIIGKSGDHASLRLEQGGRSFPAVGWRMAETFAGFSGDRLDLVYRPERDAYNGRSRIRLNLEAAREAL
jgi:single-stranded-DNA-specific exonuclease